MVDYNALAKQFGGTPVTPTAKPAVDYSALATQFGGQTAAPSGFVPNGAPGSTIAKTQSAVASTGLGRFGAGVAGEILKGGLSLGQLGFKAASGVAKVIGDNVDYSPNIALLEKGKQKITAQENNVAKAGGGVGAGKFVGEVAPYVSGEGIIAGAGEKAASILPEAAPKIAKLAAKGLGRGAAAYGIGTAVGDENKKGFAEFEAVSPAIGAALSGAASTVRKAVFPTVEDLTQKAGKYITKALGVTGKQTAKTLASLPEKRITAFKTLLDMAPKIQVTDAGGDLKQFDPKNATFSETVQAHDQAKSQIYQEVQKRLNSAGQAGLKVDTSPVQSYLNNIVESNTTLPATKQAAYNVLKTVSKITDPADLQKFLSTEVNPRLSAVLTGGDRVMGKIFLNTANLANKAIDDTLSTAKMPEIRDLQGKYSALKTIERDLVTKAKKVLSAKGTLTDDVINTFGGGQAILGLVSGNPGMIAKGVGEIASKKLLNALRDPERYLSKAFSTIEDIGKKTKVPEPIGVERQLGPGAIALGPESNPKPLGTTITPQPLAENRQLPAPTSNQNGPNIALPARTESSIEAANKANIKQPTSPEPVAPIQIPATSSYKEPLPAAGERAAAREKGLGLNEVKNAKINREQGSASAKGLATIGGLGTAGVAVKKTLDNLGKVTYQRDNSVDTTAQTTVSPERLRFFDSQSKLPKGTMNAIYKLESSKGQDTESADQGEYKWLFGMTQPALDELKRNGDKHTYDTSNIGQMADASSKYFALLQKKYPKETPAQIYVNHYWGGGTKEQKKEKIKQFNALVGNGLGTKTK